MNRFLGRLADPRTLPIVVTIVLFTALFGFGSVTYTGFFSMQVLTGLLVDNAFLLIVAIGMTFVIVSGGIDLSVGSVVALTTIFCAVGAERLHWPVWVIVPLVLAFGALYGAAMGALIHYFRLQPFIVTLAGMFLARGACFLITTQSITINEPVFHAIAGFSVPVGGGTLSAGALIALATLAGAIYVAHFTRFGRNVYAIGGNERSALLMGLPVARTKVGVRAERLLFGARRRRVHAVRAVGLRVAGPGDGTRRDRRDRDRRHAAHRRRGLCDRLGVRRRHPRHDPGADHVRRHVEFVVDADRDRRAVVRVLRAATGDRTARAAAHGRHGACAPRPERDPVRARPASPDQAPRWFLTMRRL